jgi:hypothetical protein
MTGEMTATTDRRAVEVHQYLGSVFLVQLHVRPTVYSNKILSWATLFTWHCHVPFGIPQRLTAMKTHCLYYNLLSHKILRYVS